MIWDQSRFYPFLYSTIRNNGIKPSSKRNKRGEKLNGNNTKCAHCSGVDVEYKRIKDHMHFMYVSLQETLEVNIHPKLEIEKEKQERGYGNCMVHF